MIAREELIKQFLADCQWLQAERRPLKQDASFRRYWRLRQNGQSLMLMDAPPPEKPVEVFASIAKWLREGGLYAPEIGAIDEKNGLMLLEDFGDDTFTRILARNPDRETELYALAVDTLVTLHRLKPTAGIQLPHYDEASLLNEARLLTEWFYPALTGHDVSIQQQNAFDQAWHKSLAELSPHAPVVVLRDYHVDNLMELRDSNGTRRCGLLDFQDALLGSPAYDLISLIEDARRNIDDSLKEACLQRYFEAMSSQPGALSRNQLQPWMNVLAAQRHAKVLGIFVRLYKRDKKANYLEHLPRVLALYKAALEREPALEPVVLWMAENLPFPEIQLGTI